MFLRRTLITLLLSLAALLPAFSQDVTLATQADVDAFDPDTTEILGDLTIGVAALSAPPDFIMGILDLSNLSNLTTITGNLTIGATGLQNLDGLENLVSVGELRLGNNFFLSDISALLNLSSTNGITIHGNENLTNIDALTNITDIPGIIKLTANSNLANIDGLFNINHIDSLIVSNNAALDNINGLWNLATAGGIRISNNPNLTNISGIANLETLERGLLLENNTSLSECCVMQPHLENVEFGDNIFISNNASSCSSNEEVLFFCGGSINFGILEGRVFYDQNEDCTLGVDEPFIEGIIIEAVGEEYTYYSSTNADGEYRLFTAEGGSYEIRAYPPSPYWETCQPYYLAVIPEGVLEFDIPMLANTYCTHLEVDVSSWALRECFDNIYTVSYCNEGTIPAPVAYVELSLDPILGIAEASVPFTGPDASNNYTFDVGPLDFGECGSFTVNVQLPCQPPAGQFLGQTFCLDAHIYPDSICQPANPAWDGAQIELSSECGVDSVHFKIQNIGTGDMGTSRTYKVIEDQVMFMQEQYNLNSGQEINLAFPANGSTYRLEAEQALGYPDTSMLVEIVEGCGGEPISTGFVNQFPMYDESPSYSSECRAVTGSQDPNDKQGFPYGYGDEHYIERGQSIEYLVRFQNTGTDTAFTVVIRDVISPQLNLATISPGASSHPYEFQLTDSLVSFVFNDILLPDSTTNEAASHGFVKFRIWQKPDLPIGTVIENTAAIYFDFNAPIITNTTFHTIGENFVEVNLINSVDDPAAASQAVYAYPNPFSEEVRFDLPGMAGNVDLLVFDALGREVSRGGYEAPSFTFQRQGLPEGVYFYQIQSEGVAVASGKLFVR